MPQEENRRRSRLVDRPFQFGLAFRLILVMTALFVTGLVLVFAPSIFVLATTKDIESLEPAASELLVLHKRIWPAALLSFGGLFVYILIFSNRIAGPLYRIDAVLRQFLKDEYPEKITFRDKDCFQPTAELLTELSGKLSGRKAKP